METNTSKRLFCYFSAENLRRIYRSAQSLMLTIAREDYNEEIIGNNNKNEINLKSEIEKHLTSLIGNINQKINMFNNSMTVINDDNALSILDELVFNLHSVIENPTDVFFLPNPDNGRIILEEIINAIKFLTNISEIEKKLKYNIMSAENLAGFIRNSLEKAAMKKYFPPINDEINEKENNDTLQLTKIRNDINRLSKKIDGVDLKNETTIDGMRATHKSFIKDIELLDSKLKQTSSLLDQSSEVFKKSTDYESNIKLSLEFIESKKIEIEETLQAANKKGLGGAFLSRKEEIEISMRNWAICFGLSILLLLIVGILYLFPSLTIFGTSISLISNTDKSTVSIVNGMILHLPISIPVIWLAWFSAKQYSHSSKLREDYSYKAAIAMTYEGYKNETSKISSDMHTELLSKILREFSESPIRIYEKHECVSPLHEMLDKIKPEQLNEIVKLIIEKAKK